jgi:predicted transposase YdaD
LSLNSIEVTGQAETEEELMMVLSQAYLEWEQQTEQRGRQEGEQMGILKGEQALILRLLSRRIGSISEEMRSQVEALSIVQLEALGEALLDFSEDGDLVRWLQDNNG